MNSKIRSMFRCSGPMILCLTAMVLFPSCANESKQGFDYPVAHRGDVVEDYHGTMVADPYRWMEDLELTETRDWIEAENRLTREFIDGPTRDAIKKRLTAIWDYPKYEVPHKEGDRYIFNKNNGLQNQYVYYMQDSLSGEAVPILDPNEFSDDGTIAVNGTAFSHDGTLLAYGISESGSDWQKFRIRNLDTGEEYDETLDWCKFSGIAWKPDNSGFFYNRYSDTTAVPREDWNRYNRLYWHKLGTPQSEDELIYERPDDKRLNFEPSTTYDGKYIILNVWHGTDPENRIYYRATGGGEIVRLLDMADAGYSFVENVGNLFYFRTDLDAPNGRVIAIDITKPDEDNWKEIIPEQADAIASVKIINEQLVVLFKHDACHQIKLYNLDGTFIKDIALPGIGTTRGISGKPDKPEMLFGFNSFLSPLTSYKYDLATDQMETVRAPEIEFDPSLYTSEQVFYNSKDGTRVPLFITHKKSLKLDGSNPTILYGYGGFQSSMTPFFSTSYSFWLENGGILAVACLRGGTEYGEEWHKAGMLENKQNVFDDFIAAGQWLIDNGYTSSSRLAINGGSNGGLLVAACMTQRPDLFGAVICRVPVIDMLRYHKFTVGHYWIGEYGDAENNPDDFKFLYAYSPLHNIKGGTAYPPALVTTADSDNRVYPAHSLKFVAALQTADAGDNPILLRYDTRAGHGGGKPTTKEIDEQADIYAFLFKLFDMTLIHKETT